MTEFDSIITLPDSRLRNAGIASASIPCRVRTQSDFSAPGSYVQMRVQPRAGGGSRVEMDWNRTGANLRGRVMVAFVKLFGRAFFPGYLRKTFDQLSAAPA